MTPATALENDETSKTGNQEKNTRKTLKRLIGKANLAKVKEILEQVSSKEDLQHLVSQQRYATSLLESANHYFFLALREKDQFTDHLKDRPLLASNPQTKERLEILTNRVDNLGQILKVLTAAGMGKYPRELDC